MVASNSNSDEILLGKASVGDEAAFLLLYNRYRDHIFNFVIKMIGDSEKAKEITHDCFMVLIDAQERFDANKGSLRAYLFGVARKMALRELSRSSKNREVLFDEIPEEVVVAAQVEPVQYKLQEQEFSVRLEKTLSQLTLEQREILLLADSEELSLAEIAKIYDKEIGAVKSLLHRARVRFKKLYHSVL